MTAKPSTAFWRALLTILAISYALVLAGILGAVSAQTVSLAALSGALLGCILAAAFLLAVRHELRTH